MANVAHVRSTRGVVCLTAMDGGSVLIDLDGIDDAELELHLMAVGNALERRGIRVSIGVAPPPGRRRR